MQTGRVFTIPILIRGIATILRGEDPRNRQEDFRFYSEMESFRTECLVGRRLEHVSEEILLMINEPPDLSNLQLVSMSVQCILRCPLIPVTVQA